MSTAKFDHPPYKLFEQPGYTPRPIIVGEGVDSPDTVVLQYAEEEAASKAGNPRGSSPSDFFSMSYSNPKQASQMHAYQDATYHQYSQQGYNGATQHQDATPAHINSMAVATNSSSSHGFMYGAPPSIISFQPESGTFGTRLVIKLAAQQDITMLTPQPYISVMFGTRRCDTQLHRDQDQTSFTYTLYVDAPPFVETSSQTASVPLTLVIEGGSSIDTPNLNIGSFYYHDIRTAAIQDGSSDSVPGTKSVKSPTDQPSPSQQLKQDIPPDTTYTSGYPPAATPLSQQNSLPPVAAPPVPSTSSLQVTSQSQSHQHHQHQNPHLQPNHQVHAHHQQSQPSASYGPTGYGANLTVQPNTSNTNMLGPYRATNFNDPLTRPTLRSPSWGPYPGGPLDASGRSASGLGHSGLSRSSPMTSMPGVVPNGEVQLVRTSTIPHVGGSPGGGSTYHPYGMYPNKAHLKIQGDLDMMADGWTPEEVENRRRIVLFRKSQSGSTLTISFRQVPVNERPPNSICISCIWWAEKGECFVTSVDTIHLLEQLLVAPARFSVEEKNRIRRNLEGFHPLTVSKAKADSEEFFKIIMGFPNPKPRNIEKDVKVFSWKVLGQALKKIISKYSASPSSTIPSSVATGGGGTMGSSASATLGHHHQHQHHAHAMLPVASYAQMQATGADPLGSSRHHGYGHTGHHDLSSSRAGLTGATGTQSWATHYGTRTLSPVGVGMSGGAAGSSSLRMPLPQPHLYDTRGQQPGQQQSATATSAYAPVQRWDGSYDNSNAVAAVAAASSGYPTHATSQGHVYGTPYGGDGSQRA